MTVPALQVFGWRGAGIGHAGAGGPSSSFDGHIFYFEDASVVDSAGNATGITEFTNMGRRNDSPSPLKGSYSYGSTIDASGVAGGSIVSPYFASHRSWADYRDVFTIEGWGRSTTYGDNLVLCMLGARDIWRGYATRYVGLFGDGTSMFMYLPLGSGATRFTGLARPALNTTFHWSLCSSGGNVYCSIDGTVVSVSRPADWLTYTVDEGDKIVLGCKDSYGNGWASPGWTDNIRITFGSALYTSNFAPPSGNTY